MRLLMYEDAGTSRLGVLEGNTIIDVATLASTQGRNLVPASILDLIDGGADAMEDLRSLLTKTREVTEVEGWIRPLEGTRFLPPILPRGDVIAIGRNYHEHAVESARARGEEVDRPTVFSKAQTSINGPYDDVPLHGDISSQVDWEVELGVVIGRRALNVPRAEALNYVFGYTVLNDVSARDVQFGWGGQFYKGKSLDGFCPIGPWIVTADEIPTPQNLQLRLRVNGETKQEANTSDMIFPVDDIIAQLSSGMTLQPGALIATGTPAGVGMGRTPQEWLKADDVMESEVEGIGVLRNRMVEWARETA